ncbi:hypothetical protein [uncultured Kordia sp.]|uniref:hypothetical protein n=1 Tax=uncultured Kordia sp. TaxID=507699 RepID=UPI00263633BC|nr:hypothetical protein [uncultured Kordia sp.]
MKKVFGYIFLVIGGFIGISLIMRFFQNIEKLTGKYQSHEAMDSAYIAGVITAIILMGLTSFFLIRLGLKWVKKKETPKKL